jgi:hypothetical protein
MFQIVDKIFLKKFSSTSKFNHNEFSKLKTNFERFKYVWNYENQLLNNEYQQFIDTKLIETEKADTKDLEKALKHREDGNTFYKKNQLTDALIKYNHSLKYSPLENNNNNIALTYSNRSAIFLALKKYQLCLNDIEQAFKHNYPSNSRHKLVDRKVDCLVKLNKQNEAISYLKNVLENDQLSYNDEIIKNFEAKLSILETEGLKQPDISEPALPNDSKSFKIEHSYECGNYIKSLKTIEIGEQVLVEYPFASVLLKENISTNCYDCMKRLNPADMNITFCKYCVNVSYCSESCCQHSWSTNHSDECKYFRLIVYKFGISHMEHLALRIVLNAKYDYLKSIEKELLEFESEYEATGKQYEINSAKTYESNDYKNLFHLVTHSNKRVSSDLVRRCMVAGLFTKLLVKTKFFGNEANEDSDEFYFIGGLILRHLQSISCNAHEINEFQYNLNSMATSITSGVGAGIFAMMSLFNHSCDPHVTRNFNGTACVLRTIRRVRENEQIFDNYGKLYAVNDYDDRQFKLQDQYFFDCKCEPCESKWPLYDAIVDDVAKIQYRCDTCFRTTDKIKENVFDCCFSFLDMLKNVKMRIEKDNKYCKKALKDLLEAKSPDKVKLDDAMVKFIRYMTYIDIYVATKPFQGFNDCQEALKQCFNMLGNRHDFTKID